MRILACVTTAVSLICLMLTSMMWADYRHVWRQNRESVDRETHMRLIDVCGQLAAVNRRDQALLEQTRMQLEVAYGERDDQVWRARGDSGSRKNTWARGGR